MSYIIETSGPNRRVEIFPHMFMKGDDYDRMVKQREQEALWAQQEQAQRLAKERAEQNRYVTNGKIKLVVGRMYRR